MRLDFIRPLYDRPGPFASVYLDTDRTAAPVVTVLPRRWAALKERLIASGAPAAVLRPIEEHVLESVHGSPGLAIIAEGGEIVLCEPLPVPPRRETARWSPLPHVMPLLAQRREEVPHLEVLADRTGGDVIVVAGGRRRELLIEEAAEGRIQKTGEGGWAQYNLEREVEETWRRNAAAVAAAVDREAAAIGAELIVLAGDPKARALVADHLGKESKKRLTIAEHGSRAPGTERCHFRAEVERACAAWNARRKAELLEAYAAGPYATGLQETARALRERRVQTVLLRDEPSSTATVWIGPEPDQLSTDRSELVVWGVADPVEDRADAALARAIAATNAELWFVDEIESPDGVAAVLRF